MCWMIVIHNISDITNTGLLNPRMCCPAAPPSNKSLVLRKPEVKPEVGTQSPLNVKSKIQVIYDGKADDKRMRKMTIKRGADNKSQCGVVSGPEGCDKRAINHSRDQDMMTIINGGDDGGDGDDGDVDDHQLTTLGIRI